MRIRRTILVPAILTVGTLGGVVAAPAFAAAAPVTPAIIVYHGAAYSPSMIGYHG